MILTKQVAIGSVKLWFLHKNPTKNLNTAPIPPPVKIAKSFNIFSPIRLFLHKKIFKIKIPTENYSLFKNSSISSKLKNSFIEMPSPLQILKIVYALGSFIFLSILLSQPFEILLSYASFSKIIFRAFFNSAIRLHNILLNSLFVI